MRVFQAGRSSTSRDGDGGVFHRSVLARGPVSVYPLGYWRIGGGRDRERVTEVRERERAREGER